MEQFRPAKAIEADRVLAESFRDGDDAAIRAVVRRFGGPVASLLTAHGAGDLAVDVFVQAWVESDDFDPGDDLAPWLREIALTLVDHDGGVGDAERWELAAATVSFDPDVHDALRRHHVDGDALAPGAERHELRLERRLGHLVDATSGIDVLADPLVWERPPDDLADRVVARIADESESAADGSFGAPIGRSRLSRSVRPVLLGLVGAIVVLFVAIIALSAASGSVDEPAFTVELVPTGRLTQVEPGEVTVTEGDNGLTIDVDAFTLPRRAGDQFYETVLVLVDGTEFPAGSFSQGFGVTLSAGIELDRVTDLLIFAATLGVEADDNDAVLKADFVRS